MSQRSFQQFLTKAPAVAGVAVCLAKAAFGQESREAASTIEPGGISPLVREEDLKYEVFNQALPEGCRLFSTPHGDYSTGQCGTLSGEEIASIIESSNDTNEANYIGPAIALVIIGGLISVAVDNKKQKNSK